MVSLSPEISNNPRDEIINTYLATIQDSFIDHRPQIKLINFGTGSGKTHQLFQAVCETIQTHSDMQIIGVYVAPLREHLHTDVKKEYPQIPFYVLYSQDKQVEEEFLKQYKAWIPAIRNNKAWWNRLEKLSSKETSEEHRESLFRAGRIIERFESLLHGGFDPADKFFSEQILICKRDILKILDKYLVFVIKNIPDEREWTDECFQLVEIFFPLYLLREKSGVLLLTYDKFETKIPYFRFNGKEWIKKTDLLDAYISAQSSDTRKFIFAFDEQEDGYQIMLDKQISIIYPEDLAINNALSSITREFSVLFSSKYAENRALLQFLRNNPGAYTELEEHFEKGKVLAPKLAAFAPAYERLVIEEGNSHDFLREVAKISEKIEKSVKGIVGFLGGFSDSDPVTLDFDMLSRVFSKFENNRSLLIPQKVYTKFSDDLMNIFSYNNLFIYNIEPLKKLYLSHKPDGHVHITEKKTANTASVAELIYAVFAVRFQIEAIQEFLANVLNAQDSQSRSLDIWSSQIGKMKDAGDTNLSPEFLKYLNRAYVYQSLKTVINIMEIARYKHLIHSSMREVSIGSTAVMTSPEHRIINSLKNNTNVIFLISATGGVAGDRSTSFDLRYLEDQLRDESGKSSFNPMRAVELELSEKIRTYRRQLRDVSVGFFVSDLISFPNVRTVDVVKRFEDIVLKSYARSHEETTGFPFGQYKIQELRSFVRFLFYLFEDDAVQETIVFTQTLRWIRELIVFTEKNGYEQFKFSRSTDNPGIIYFEIDHPAFPTKLKIKLVFYESRFNEKYSEKSKNKEYAQELVEEDGQKIFFISAYQSAAKGLNPTILDRNGKSKDFDSIVLLMDRYFSLVGPSLKTSDKESSKAETMFHFALMKNVVRFGDTSIEIKDFNKYLNSPEAKDFQSQQHQILLGKGTLQALGRTERRYYPNQVIKIFINDETRKNLVNFYRYLDREEPEEIRKLSVNNYAVYESVKEEERKHTIQDYDTHVFTEVDAVDAIQRFRKTMLDEIENLHEGKETFDIVRAWELLRDPIAFKSPAKYLEKLHASGLFPSDFVDALFYHSAEPPAFTPFLSGEEAEDGRTVTIISDSAHGEKVYPYRDMLFPDYMRMNAGGFDIEGETVSVIPATTANIQRLYRKLMPQSDIFDLYIPRPNFFYDVLFPSLSESFTDMWIQQGIFNGKSWETITGEYDGIEPLTDFKKYRELFELFDLYYVKKDTIYCIDVKAWSEASGYRLSTKTVNKAKAKLETITREYPQFKVAKGLLLNLHAPLEKYQKYATNLYSGNLICFDSNHLPFESAALHNFLFRKEE